MFRLSQVEEVGQLAEELPSRSMIPVSEARKIRMRSNWIWWRAGLMDSLHMLCSNQQAKELVLKAVNENGVAAHAKSELWKELERVNVRLDDVESFARKTFSKTGIYI